LKSATLAAKGGRGEYLRLGREEGTMKWFTRVSVLVAVLALGPAVTASADDVYHTERLEFVGADADFHGQVINIHPNGPVNGALERYQIVRAAPQTSYDVWIQFCSNGAFTDFMRTTGIVTNRQGNGHARAKFTAAQLGPFSGVTVSIRWVLKSGGAIAYTTACTTVTID
jgi:hypothetical protein